MALIEAQIYSDVLMLDVNVSLILPLPSVTNLEYGDDVPTPANAAKYPTLWMIHPAANNYSKIVRRSRIENYAREKRIAVVMMDLGHSYCCNNPSLGNYFNYYTEELPRILRGIFPLSEKREDNFIGGISMGGFGAFKAAAKKPENYAAAFSISGGLDLDEVFKNSAVDFYTKRVKQMIFGDRGQYYDPQEHDLRVMMKELASSGKVQPQFYACCGLQDSLQSSGKPIIDYMRSLSLMVDYEEGDGAHNFDYYDPMLKHIITDWLPENSRKGEN